MHSGSSSRSVWALVVAALAVGAIVLAYPVFINLTQSRPSEAARSAAPSSMPVPISDASTAPIGGATPMASLTPTQTPRRLAPPDQQVLRLQCCYTDPRSLRAQAASGSDEVSILNAIQRGLLYVDSELNVVPMMARDMPDVSADGTVYTFHLGDWAYSDGSPVVAGDFVRGARALADPRNAFDYGYLMCWVAGVDDVLGTDFGCSDGDTPYADRQGGTFNDDRVERLLDRIGVEAPDDRTVVFTLKQPVGFWNNIVATWLLTPIPESQRSWAEAADILASGPFMIESWQHNSRMTLVPNPHWRGLKPTLQRIELMMAGDPVEAVHAWERGDLDVVRVPSIDVGRVLATREFGSMVKRSTNLAVDYYDFANCQATDAAGTPLCPPNEAVTKGVVGGSPTQNLHFRQALTQAIDKADMIEVAFGGIGVPAYSPTMPGIPGFPSLTADTAPLGHDPAAALVEMATALEELGVAAPDARAVLPATDTCDSTCQHTRAWVKMLGPLRFGYNCDAGHDARVMYLANSWRETLGFDQEQFDARCTDFGCCRFESYPGNIYDIERAGWGADYAHPDNQNRDRFTCDGRSNSSKYCNPVFDALLEQGARASSYEEAVPFYRQAEELLAADAPVLFLRYGEFVSLVRPWVLDYIATPLDQMNVGDLFYEGIKIAAH